jgi:hypothetical protein
MVIANTKGSTSLQGANELRPLQQENQPDSAIHRTAMGLGLNWCKAVVNHPAKALTFLIGLTSIGIASQRGLTHWNEQGNQKIKLLIADMGGEEGLKHSKKVAYVANSFLQGNKKIEVDIFQEGLSQNPCELFDQINSIAVQSDPPNVVLMPIFGSPSDTVIRNKERIDEHFTSHFGRDMLAWSHENVLMYQNTLFENAQSLSKQYLGHLAQQCDDGLSVLEKRKEALDALSEVGVTVVLSVGNNGALANQMDMAKVKIPDGLFNSLLFPDGEVIPDGVIVVGGSEKRADGSHVVAGLTTPHSATDVLAQGVNIQVGPDGQLENGSSFSVPQVAALAARMIDINPKLTPSEIKKLIVSTATALDDANSNGGIGVLNQQKTIEAVKRTLNA